MAWRRLLARLTWEDAPSLLGVGYRIEIEGEGTGASRVLIGGVQRILVATDGEVVLLLAGVRLSLRGAELVCLSLEGRLVEICGKILEISFLGGDVL